MCFIFNSLNMKPGTFTQMCVQLVFAVQNKENILSEKIKPGIFKYTSRIFRNLKHKSIIINGPSDHIHILLGLNPSVSVSDTVHDIKRGSSLFIIQNRLVHGRFSWQEGYGAFTYSLSQIEDVYRYIEDQEMHHSKKTFRQEYMTMLEHNGIEFDARFLFDFF